MPRWAMAMAVWMNNPFERRNSEQISSFESEAGRSAPSLTD